MIFLYLIAAIIIVGVALKVGKTAVSWLCSAIKWLLIVLIGPACLMGKATFTISALANSQVASAFIVAVVLWAVGLSIGTFGASAEIPTSAFSFVIMIMPAFLALFAATDLFRLKRMRELFFDKSYYEKKLMEFGIAAHSAGFLALLSAGSTYALTAAGVQDTAVIVSIYYFYWISSLLLFLYPILAIRELQPLFGALSSNITQYESFPKADLYAIGEEKTIFLNEEDLSNLVEAEVAKHVTLGSTASVQIDGADWLFRRDLFDLHLNALNLKLSERHLWNLDDLNVAVELAFNMKIRDTAGFCENSLEIGRQYFFEQGENFVSDQHRDKIRVCVSCGHAKDFPSDDDVDSEWICSPVCQKTENICIDLKELSHDAFVSRAATSGMVLMEGGRAWSDNQKVFATGGQGHGHAAERANNRIDRLMLRSAEIVGDDNAKNGPDRLVEGQYIQTKYHRSGARSVGAAFDGQAGKYKYFDENNQPMPVEVPKDQYAKAVETMRKKIAEGKVPGVTDPKDAATLVKKGSLTYQQAQNITKFGTFESIAYDVSEGVIVGAAAGGISFCITATIYYIHTKDANTALRVAVIEAGKSFGKTVAVYLTTQQLHRLPPVDTLLKSIDLAKCPNSVSNFFMRAFNVKSVNAANKVLRGTVVTSLVIIVASTGSGLVKVARGRMSMAQLGKNLSVTTAGLAGGFLGGAAGGSMFGPVGAFIGGMAGGVLSGKAADSVVGSYIRQDVDVVLAIVRRQTELLIVMFMLSESEIDVLQQNLTATLVPSVIEQIFAAKKNRLAMANHFIKPLVVYIVRQRPVLIYHTEDIIDACAEVVP